MIEGIGHTQGNASQLITGIFQRLTAKTEHPGQRTATDTGLRHLTQAIAAIICQSRMRGSLLDGMAFTL